MGDSTISGSPTHASGPKTARFQTKVKIVGKEHEQLTWNDQVEGELRELVRLAVVEDLEGSQDWTTVSLVPASVPAKATIVSRVDGVIAGVPAAAAVLDEMKCTATCETLLNDGDKLKPGTAVANLVGPAREILTAERVILNTMCRLSGIATLAAKFVEQVAGTKAGVYDTRKTTPGWRRLEKYAVKCGGGTNHRGGLNRAVLIKDNHIAFGNSVDGESRFSVAESVEKARAYVSANAPNGESMIIQIEVDSLEQLAEVLPMRPDIVLLDNMSTEQLTNAVSMRDNAAVDVELEASGGINLTTIKAVAATGVDRISVGALTHSAPNLDLGLDWGDR